MNTDDRRIRLACQVRPSPHALVQMTGDEAIVLDTAGERYFGLNAVGARLWTLLAGNPDLQLAHDRLLEEYDVDRERLETDLLAIVNQLADAGLVAIG